MRRKVLATPPLDEDLVVLVIAGLFLVKIQVLCCDWTLCDSVVEVGGDT